MRSSGAMLLSSAATSSCAIALSSASFASCTRYSKTAAASFRGMHAEDDDLIFEAELGQQRGEVAGVPVAQHVAQPRVVAGAQHRRQFVGGPGHLANRRERLVALRAGELLFHLFQRCSDDVVMMHVRADGFDGVEPEAVNQIEIAGREGGRMGAEVIGVGAPAAVIDDQSNVERLRACRPVPRPRRAGGPDRRPRASTIRRRRRPTIEVEGRSRRSRRRRCARDDQQPHRTADPLGERDDIREQPPFVPPLASLARQSPR